MMVMMSSPSSSSSWWWNSRQISGAQISDYVRGAEADLRSAPLLCGDSSLLESLSLCFPSSSCRLCDSSTHRSTESLLLLRSDSSKYFRHLRHDWLVSGEEEEPEASVPTGGSLDDGCGSDLCIFTVYLNSSAHWIISVLTPESVTARMLFPSVWQPMGEVIK